MEEDKSKNRRWIILPLKYRYLLFGGVILPIGIFFILLTYYYYNIFSYFGLMVGATILAVVAKFFLDVISAKMDEKSPKKDSDA